MTALLMSTGFLAVSAGSASAAPAGRTAGTPVRLALPTATSPLGKQVCSGTAGFVYVLFATGTSLCWDGGQGNIPLGSNAGVLVAVLDNMSGHSVWMSGALYGQVTFSYCFDRGYVFGLGPPATGEGGAKDLYPYSMSEGSTTPCSVGADAYGTSEPGQVPIPCGGGLYQGPLVFGYATTFTGQDTLVRNWCEPGIPAGQPAHVYTNPFGPYFAVVLANGTRGALIVTGSGSAGDYTDCLDNNQVISPFNTGTDKVSDIGVTAAGTNC